MSPMEAPKLSTTLPEEGPHHATLSRVFRFNNAHGARIGFEFRLASGDVVMASATPSDNPHSKLAELLRGLLGRELSQTELYQLDYQTLHGVRCRVLVRHEHNRSGTYYPAVRQVFR